MDTREKTLAGTLVGLACLLVTILAWIHPFQPVGRAPLAHAAHTPSPDPSPAAAAPIGPSVVPPPIHAATPNVDESRPPTSASRPPSPDPITIGEAIRHLPDAHAAAADALRLLRSAGHTVRGHLRGSQGDPDSALQNLITTVFILDVTIADARGTTTSALTVTSRGGGFSSDTSALQARERLRAAVLRELPLATR